MSFKDHFSTQTGAYARARPTYPVAWYDWLATQVPARQLAWDVGCGTGQASGDLARRFERVVATDPSSAQIAAATSYDNVDYRVEAAEASSLAAASVDLVHVAQAYHWFDHDRFAAEVRRVARPGAIVAAVGYRLLRIAPAIDALVDELHDDIVGPYWPPERIHVERGLADLPFAFDEVHVPTIRMDGALNMDQLLDYFGSWSALARYRTQVGRDPLPDFAGRLRPVWGDPATVREVDWQFFARVGRALPAMAETVRP